MDKVQKRFSSRCAPRYLIAWVLIVCILLGIIGALLYNINAIMILFDKGKVSLRSFEGLRTTVVDLSDQYTITQDSIDPSGNLLLSYQTKNQVAAFTVLSDSEGKDIAQIQAVIDISKFDLTQITKLYSFTNTLIKPICRDRDILAAEIGLLKTAGQIDLVRYENYIYQEHVFDEKFITLRKEKNSYLFQVAITPI